MNKYIRINEAAESLAVNANTLRRWLIQYERFISTKKDGKVKLIHNDSLVVLERIRDYYKENKLESEIMELLHEDIEVIREGKIIEHEQQKEHEQMVNEQMNALNQKIDNVVEQNLHMHQELQQIKETMNNRDGVLMEVLRGIQEMKQARIETAAETVKTPWWAFWRK